MICKLAMPHHKVIAVSVRIKSCNTTKGSENQGCGGCKDISFVTSAVVDNQFGVAMACKESSYIHWSPSFTPVHSHCILSAGGHQIQSR
jgi:hypothetical protein